MGESPMRIMGLKPFWLRLVICRERALTANHQNLTAEALPARSARTPDRHVDWPFPQPNSTKRAGYMQRNDLRAAIAFLGGLCYDGS